MKKHLVFTTWNHIIPIGWLDSSYHIGDSFKRFGNIYYVNCEPNTVTPSGHVCKHYYCVYRNKGKFVKMLDKLRRV